MCVLTSLFFKGLKQNVILIIAMNLSVMNLIVSVATGNNTFKGLHFLLYYRSI